MRTGAPLRSLVRAVAVLTAIVTAHMGIPVPFAPQTTAASAEGAGRQLWAWGYGANGALGTGSYSAHNAPVAVDGFSDVVGLAAGTQHSLFLRADGTVWGAGYNGSGQLGTGSTNPNVNSPVQAFGLNDVVEIEDGPYHSLARRSDGTVWAWGQNYHGQIGTGFTATSGCYCEAAPTHVFGLTDVVDVAGSYAASFALRADGTVWAWGTGLIGAFGATQNSTFATPQPVVGLDGVVAVAAGDDHAVAVRNDGTVWTWGDNDYGQLGNGLFGWSTGRNEPAQVLGVFDAVAVDAGFYHNLVLHDGGSITGWGSNRYGELGNGSTAWQQPLPVRAAMTGARAIAAGGYHSKALGFDTTLWAWGDNIDGELGIGSNTDTSMPVPVGTLIGVAAAESGGYHSFAMGERAWYSSTTSSRFGHLSTSGYSEDPVETSTGNFLEHAVDLDFPENVTGMGWSRTYNALDARRGPLGQGWSGSFDTSVRPLPSGDVEYHGGDGRITSFVRTGPDTPCASKHPDAGGYRCEATTYHWEDMTGATALSLPDDGSSSAVSIPFPFSWYGASKAAVHVGSNGLLCFDPSQCYASWASEIPDSWAPNDYLACFWEDLNPSAGGTVRYKGTASGLVVEFDAVPHYGGSLVNTFQLQLLPNGDARCMYADVKNDGDYDWTGAGIENATGSTGTTYRLEEFAAQTTGVRFTSAPDTASTYRRPGDLFGDLRLTADGTYRIEHDNGTVESFDAAGRIAGRTSWDGQVVTFAYDADRLSGVTASTGHSLAFTYTGDRLTRVQADDGRSVVYEYGPSGALGRVVDANGSATVYETDPDGRITRITDADGKLVVSNEYDDRGRVARQETPGGDEVTFAYTDGETSVTRTSTGAVTRYLHDRQGRLLSMVDAFGAVLSKSYDAAGNLVSVTDRRNGSLTQTFDTHGNLLTRATPEGVTESWAYDGADRLVSTTDGEGGVTHFTYEGAERLPARTTDPSGTTTTLEVVEGLVRAVVDPDAVTITLGYDSRRNLASVADDRGARTAFAHDAAGNRIRETTPTGRIIAFALDNARRPISTTDPTGATTSWTWTPGGRLSSETDATGATISYAYDAHGRLASMTDARGKVTTLAYDPSGNVTGVTKPGGATWSFAYDALGRRVSETDPTGVTITHGQDADGNRTTTTDEAGEAVERQYDLRGRLTRIEDQLGNGTALSWDKNDRLVSKTEPTGAITSFRYDAAGRLLETVDPEGGSWSQRHSTQTVVDASGHGRIGRLSGRPMPALVDSPWAGFGKAVSLNGVEDGPIRSQGVKLTPAGTALAEPFTLELAFRRSAVSSDRSEFLASRMGNGADSWSLLTSLDQSGALRVTVKDGSGQPVSLTSAPVLDVDPHRLAAAWDGTTMRLFLDGAMVASKPLSSLTAPDPSVPLWLGRSDSDAARPGTFRGELDEVRLSRGARYTGAYTPASAPFVGDVDTLGLWHLDEVVGGQRVVETEDPEGNISTFVHDSRGDVAQIIDPEGGVTSMELDQEGRIKSRTSAAGLTEQAEYDTAGRLAVMRDATGAPEQRFYTSRGEIERVVDRAGGQHRFWYYPSGELQAAQGPGGGVTQYFRDDRGNLATRRDARQGDESYTYDLADRLLTRTDALQRVTTRVHDQLGRLASAFDSSGRSTSFAYDDAGRVTGRTFGDGITVSYAYDAAGHRTSMQDAVGTTTYEWDKRGLLLGTEAYGEALTFAYDAAGRRTKVVYPNGSAATSTQDGTGRVTDVSHPEGDASFTYDADGRLLSEDLPGDVGRRYTYQLGRLASFVESTGGSDRTTTFARDAAGRVTTETTAGAATTYGYDLAGNLASVTKGGETTSYVYDGVGNRTSKTTGATRLDYQYDAAQQLSKATKKVGSLPAGTVAFSYDGGGRMTAATGTAGSRSFQYDARGLLSRTVSAAGTALVATDRTTDGDGGLVQSKTTSALGTSDTHLLWDPSAVVPEPAVLDDDGTDSLIVQGAGESFAVTGGDALAFSKDAYGSVLKGGPAAGLARAEAYDEFGRPTPSSPVGLVDEVLGSAQSEVRLGYRGELHVDSLVHLRARDYAPTLGRFTSEDPLPGVPGTTTEANPYPYAANDPLQNIDPLGLRPVRDTDFLLESAIGLDIASRNQVMSTFFSTYPGNEGGPMSRLLGVVGDHSAENLGFGMGVLQFAQWEFGSGRFDQFTGSAWWKAVNGRMVLDMLEAFVIISEVGIERAHADWRLHTTRPDDGVAAWIDYAIQAVGPASAAARQGALWNAHQRSLHNGIEAASHLLAQESANEQAFIEQVVRNVDLAAINRLPTNDVQMGVYLTRTYPSYGGVTDAALDRVRDSSVEVLFECGRTLPAVFPGGCVSSDELVNIGTGSTRW